MPRQQSIPEPIGWPLLPVPDKSGSLRYPDSLDASVQQSIRVILSTRAGEQLRRPRFGAGLDRFINDTDSLLTRRRIHDTVVESLDRWEDRIKVDRVEVEEVDGRPGYLRVEINYRLLRNGATRQLGLTLQTGA